MKFNMRNGADTVLKSPCFIKENQENLRLWEEGGGVVVT
jgi:hypothetical protein